jgi:predicted RNA-binding Zn ribbon-like protein
MSVALSPDRFVGGAICLDFVNTIDAPDTPQAKDRLGDYEAVLRWSAARGILPPMTLGKLRRLAERRPEAAERQWRQGMAIRHELRQLFTVAQKGDIPSRSVLALNERLAVLPRLLPLGRSASGRTVVFRAPGSALAEPFWSILWSAAAVLTSDDLARLGRCQAPPCRYFFIDLSRNRSRNWCSTESCGNRVRVRRAYAVRRAAAEAYL